MGGGNCLKCFPVLRTLSMLRFHTRAILNCYVSVQPNSIEGME